MKISFKRLVVLFVILCVTMTFTPMSAFADEYDDDYIYDEDDYDYYDDEDYESGDYVFYGDPNDPTVLIRGIYYGVYWKITESGDLIIGKSGETQTFPLTKQSDGYTFGDSFYYEAWNHGFLSDDDFTEPEFKDKVKTIKFEGKVIADGNYFSGMFRDFKSLTTIDFTNFNTSNVTNMSALFRDCSSLTSINFSNFDTGKTTDMHEMFYGCSSLTDLDLTAFDTKNVTNMSNMFRICSSLKNINISNIDTGNVTDMSYMFGGCSSLKNVNISNIDTGNVMDMSYMFDECSSLTNVDLSYIDARKVTDMSSMFSECSSLTNVDLSNIDARNVTDMSSMFFECSSLTNVDLSNIDTRNVTDMSSMFYACGSLTNLDLSNFNTSNVTDMDSMFLECKSLLNLDLSSFNTSNVTSMDMMFRDCTSLTNVDLSSFDTKNVTNMGNMFCNCTSLKELDLSSFDMSNVIADHFENGINSSNIFVGVNVDTLKTPNNLKSYESFGYLMYDNKGNEYFNLPQNSSSILLTRDKPSSLEGNVDINSIDTFKISDQTWNGKAKKPSPKLYYNGTKLTKNVDYKLSYKKNTNVGNASLVITGIGNYSGTLTKTFKIIPKKPMIKNPKAAKKAITVNWKAMKTKMSKKRITGYQVQIAKNKKFTKSKKSFKVKGYKETSYTFTKLKSKTKYFVRVRTYRTISGKTYYSKWSSVKNIKTK